MKNNEWDNYWSKKNITDGIVSFLYDRTALFYRKYIISNSLSFFLDKNYKANSVLLHAGCGCGDTDERVSKKFRIVSLDTSPVAVKTNSFSDLLMQGDIFHMPLKEKSLDGIYNIGLMEHFTEKEIVEMLKKFSRVLKQDGKIILFWPAEFSLYVILLKAALFIINSVFRGDIKLQPDEISRVKSYTWVKTLCEKGNFEIMEHYFGPKDFFAFVVITLQKKV